MFADLPTAAWASAYDIPPSIVANSSPQRNSQDAAPALRANASGSAMSSLLNVISTGLSKSVISSKVPAAA
jgi:hypothetical protein